MKEINYIDLEKEFNEGEIDILEEEIIRGTIDIKDIKDKIKIYVYDLRQKFNLNLFALELENTEYEPEQFPGLIYRDADCFKTLFFLLNSGRIYCVSNGQEGNARNALIKLKEKIYKIIEGYKK